VEVFLIKYILKGFFDALLLYSVLIIINSILNANTEISEKNIQKQSNVDFVEKIEYCKQTFKGDNNLNVLSLSLVIKNNIDLEVCIKNEK
jgi:hypothetical protein